MNHRIENLPQKKLIGNRTKMSFAQNMTFELWNGFMKRRGELSFKISEDLFSLQIYPPLFFQYFDQNSEFEKWAAVEVENFDEVPADMHTLILESGLYAVFIYKGLPDNASDTFRYILGEWMSQSGFTLDDRPHFEILGEKYKHDSSDSEEEIWIPLKAKE